MRLTVLGCAGSFPAPDSACSSYLVEAEGFRLLVDLGSGALSALQRQVGLDGIDAVVVSHLHADHWSDLSGYAVSRTYAPDGPLPPVPVYGPVGTADRIAQLCGGPQDAVLDVRVLRPGRVEIGPFGVTAGLVNHPVETYGLRVQHGGRTLAYSADSGPSDELVALAAGSDLLLCEASFLERPDNPPDLHLTGRQAGEHATRAGVGRLLLTHLVAWNDPARSVEEATGAFGGECQAARAEVTYDV